MTNWLYNLSERTHLLFAPVLFLLLCGGLTIAGMTFSTDDLTRSTMPMQQFVGTSALFTLLPAYLLLAAVKQRHSTQGMLDQLARWSVVESHQCVIDAMINTPYWRYIVVFAGFLFGLSQNELYVRSILETGAYTLLDVVFVAQSACLWTLIAEFIAWRFSVTYAVSKFAQTLNIGVYETHNFGIVARMATTDVLVVAGAMAFMPLQSLDAEFRIQNYQAGFIIGISAAACLMMVPLFGARQRILTLKQQRLSELSVIESGIKKDDIERLESHLAHADRIRSIPNWPIDLNLLTRIFGYVIIPPIAWVGAAVVERLINF